MPDGQMKVTALNMALTAEMLRHCGETGLHGWEQPVGQHKRSVAGDRPLDSKSQNHSPDPGFPCLLPALEVTSISYT